MTASMRRQGECWENEVSVKAHAQSVLCRNYNAPMESFWGIATIKEPRVMGVTGAVSSQPQAVLKRRL